ncbi:MAG: hypothetical protein IJU11_02150 [Prevotella sp.]|nr:hypothetical protein [Prevotella sp.]
MEITLNFSTLYAKVARSLSIIGKRSIDDKGNLLFRDITLGTRERQIINDFFANAFTELSAELNKFITAEVQNYSGLTDTIYTSFWTDQPASSFVDQVTADGQYLYNYNLHKLYQASLSFPYGVATAPAGGLLAVYNDSYYSWDGTDLTQITEEQVAELTDEEKSAAKVITFFNVAHDADEAVVSSPEVYLYDGVSLYVSERSCSFSEVALSATTLYYDPDNVPYQWLYGALQRLDGNTTEGIQLTVTTPDNWNGALELSVRQALFNYCVSYALYSWFTVTAPRISDKYLADTTRQLAAIRQLIHEKKPPVGSVSPLSISTEIIENI